MKTILDYQKRDALIAEAFDIFLKLHNGKHSLAYASLAGGLIANTSVSEAEEVLQVAKKMYNEKN